MNEIVTFRDSLRIVRRAARTIALGGLCGALAGLIAGGMGSRIAMRVVALAAGHRFYGARTEADAIVGKITLEGTLFLLTSSAIFSIPFGVLYVAVRSCLPGASGLVRGLSYGAVLLAIFGAVVIDPDNFDFTRFVSPYLAVGLFVALFPLFGIIAGLAAERFHPSVANRPRRAVMAAVWLAASVPIAIGTVRLVLAFQRIFG